ncbi:Up-regulated during septation-domain-containing protein [Amylostereum chailletii]|nr:Up-regulated during septation-domain-containing protein [Amylostereum chailletii]
MNGVRRFLGGPSSSSSPPQLPPTTPLSSIPPLNFSFGSGSGSRSPSPTKPYSANSEYSTASKDSASQPPTPGLFIRKDRKPPPSHTNGHANGGSVSRPASETLSSPVAGPSSPRKMNGDLASSSKRGSASGFASTRDELLMSLLSSEAVVDSRGYAILNSEELEDLKKEHTLLLSRLTAAERTHTRELKMRDAALHLEKLNSSPSPASSRVAKRSSEAVDAANRRVDAAQRELWRLKERANDIGRRIVEHQAGVLGIAVKELERKTAGSVGSGSTTETDAGTGTGWSTPSGGMLSPTSSVTSMSTNAPSRRFDGPHLFAGHEGALVPKRARAPMSQKEVAELEERLAGKDRELEGLRAELDTSRAEAERWEAETTRWERELAMADEDKERWEQDRAAYEEEKERLDADMDELEARVKTLEAEKGELERERESWEQERERWEQELGMAAVGKGDSDQLQQELAEERRARAKEKSAFEEERAQWEEEKNAWTVERANMDMDREEIMERARDEVDVAREQLRELVQRRSVPLFSRENSLATYADALDKALASSAGSAGAAEEKKALEAKLALEVEKSESLISQLDAARAELNALESKIEVCCTDGSLAPSEKNPSTPLVFATDAERIISLLQPLWASLPSPESRATKFSGATRPFRTGSPGVTRGPASPSISEMDVRSLKGLYSPKVPSASPAASPDGTTKERLFSVEAFATRVQALIQDDRALIERLIRFAQAHDLLKKNAERAQKLAGDSNGALQTYQRQVEALEKRDADLKVQLATLQQDVRQQDEVLERVLTEKQELEMSAAEQAETLRELTEANASLSGRVLALGEELAVATREREEIRGAGETQEGQRIALLEELNNVQTENGMLRQQLRAMGKK